MMKKKLFFAHGNGFPALCYKQMLACLQQDFACFYLDRIGHNPRFPVTDNWPYLVQELIEYVEANSKQPVIAVGHSLGGVLNLFAAIQRPDLFTTIILLDSPLIGVLKSRTVRWAKIFGLIDRITPAAQTRKRREHWSSKEQVLSYLRKRDLFKTFTAACLNDYVEHGLIQDNTGYHLRFDRTIEYQIYRTIPHIITEYEGRLLTPSSLIYGDKSTVVDRMDLGYMEKNFNINAYPIQGTHLFPLECPEATARQIRILLEGQEFLYKR